MPPKRRARTDKLDNDRKIQSLPSRSRLTDPAFAGSVSPCRYITLTRPFPRRVQYLIPAIRSGFFRVRPESLVQGQLTPFIRLYGRPIPSRDSP